MPLQAPFYESAEDAGQLLRELLTIPAPIRSGTLQITDAQRIAYSMDARVAMAFAADLLGHIGADRRNSAEDTAMDAWGWLQQRRDTRWDFKKAGEPERCPACRLVNRHRAGCPKQNEP